MKTFDTKISGVKLIKSDSNEDDRGFFQEAWHKDKFEALGLPIEWPQDNVSTSFHGVIRGLHIQKGTPQGKLIRCLFGVVWDVWVDLRKESPTFKKWEAITLNYLSHEAIYLPPGLAHGFLAIQHPSVVAYKCTTVYDKESDGGIRWDDPELAIEWPLAEGLVPIVSVKDTRLPTLDEYLKTLG